MMEKKSEMINKYDIWTLMHDYYAFMDRYVKGMDDINPVPFLIAAAPVLIVITILFTGVFSSGFLINTIFVVFIYICAYFGGYLKTEGEEDDR